jgi:hypothetical protein
MAQYSVPSADITDGNWLDDGAGATDIYLSIVPIVPGTISGSDDATYAESEANPDTSFFVVDMSTIEDPESQSGHVLRWRRQKDAAGGGQIDLVVALHEGYINEGTPGTVISTNDDNDLSETPATTTDPLDAGEADSIGSYDDLQVRFVATQST